MPGAQAPWLCCAGPAAPCQVATGGCYATPAAGLPQEQRPPLRGRLRFSRPRKSKSRRPSPPGRRHAPMRGLLKGHSAYTPAFPIKGRCAGHPHPFVARQCLAALRMRLPVPSLDRAGLPASLGHANPHRIGTDRLLALECFAVLQEAARSRACSLKSKARTPKRLAQIVKKHAKARASRRKKECRRQPKAVDNR